MEKKMKKAIEDVRERCPLIHCVTNPISINLCANGIIAVGGRPIMAEHPFEVADITSIADGLLLNLGNITDVRMESMMISACTSKNKSKGAVLDVVGVGCSPLRRDFADRLIYTGGVSVIKGNYSEIISMCNRNCKTRGVDTESHDEKAALKSALWLSKETGAVVLASGKTDIIVGGNRILYIKNGTPMLSSITGSGCLLGALTACYMAYADSYIASSTACATLGICGELSASAVGNGSFLSLLLDNICKFNGETLYKYLKKEELYA